MLETCLSSCRAIHTLTPIPSRSSMIPMPAPAPIPKSFQSKPFELGGTYVYWSCPAAAVRSRTSGIAVRIRQRGAQLLGANRPLDDVRAWRREVEPRVLATVEHRGLLSPLKDHDGVDDVVLALVGNPRDEALRGCRQLEPRGLATVERPGLLRPLKCCDRVDRVVLALEPGVGLRDGNESDDCSCRHCQSGEAADDGGGTEHLLPPGIDRLWCGRLPHLTAARLEHGKAAVKGG